MSDNIRTRRLTKADVPTVVAVHLSAFSDFFLTSLGSAFLEKYYKAVIEHKESICVGCEDDRNQLLGFAIGSQLSKGFHAKLLREHPGVFFLQGLRIMFTNPK